MPRPGYTVTTISISGLEKLRELAKKDKRSMIEELNYLIETREKELKK